MAASWKPDWERLEICGVCINSTIRKVKSLKKIFLKPEMHIFGIHNFGNGVKGPILLYQALVGMNHHGVLSKLAQHG
jgi:hypothetical protein